MPVTVNMVLLKLLLLLLLRSYFVYGVKPINIRIGVISDSTDDVRQNDPKFWAFSNNYSSTVTVAPLVANVQWWDSLQIRRAVCSLFNQGVDGLLSFPPPNVGPILSSYSTIYGLPFITKSSTNSPASSQNFVLQMIPDAEAIISKLLDFYKWKSFAFLYDSDNGPLLLEQVLVRNPQVEVEAVWRVSNSEQAVRYLELLEFNSEYQQKKEVQNVLWAADNDALDEALVSMPVTFRGTLRFHFISAHPILRLKKRYFPVWHLVTRLCLVDSNSTTFKNLESRWLTLPKPYARTFESSPSGVPENAMVTYDIIGLLSTSYDSLTRRDDTFGLKQNDDYAVKTQCSQNPEKKVIIRSSTGTLASNNLKDTVLANGVTGKVKFDESGDRTDFGLYIYQTNSSVTKKVGEWSDYEGLRMSIDKTSSTELGDDPSDKKEKESQQDKTIIVTSILTAPFLMQKRFVASAGNDRFVGFVKDLMDQVSETMNTKYEIRVVKDGKYGSYDGNSWNGMVGEVIRGDADVAVAPLTVSRPREEVIDFTLPFMTHGLNILIKKPAVLDGRTSASMTPFDFLSAFNYDTWLVLIAVYIFFGIGFFVVSRFTGSPDRIRSVDTKGSDQLSLCSSFWFAAGSLCLQNTGIYPRSISHRLLSVVWWIFTLITVIAYIGSLSSMLIKERTRVSGSVDNYLTSFQLLKNFMETGTPSIGVQGSGTTEEFFKSSQVGIYHDYGKFIEHNRGVITRTYSEGIERVRKSNGSFAFIMESASSELVSNNPPCDTVATSGYLDSRAYSMAVKKGSGLRESLDQVLLDILESGALRQIYEKWWHKHPECSNPLLNVLPSIYDSSLSIVDVAGVFCILIIGIVIASISAVVEYCIRSRKLPVDK